MNEATKLVFWPMAASPLPPGLLADHGLQVIRREVILRFQNVEP